MSLDAYSPCVGGLNKKIKFCGCKDIIHELDQIHRSIEGDQRVAALQEIDQQLAKTPGRACLLHLRFQALLAMGEREQLGPPARDFVAVHPRNPLALANLAQFEAISERVREAVEQLQRALEECEETIPVGVVATVHLVARALHASAEYPAARAHAVLLLQMVQNKSAAEFLTGLDSDPRVGHAFKHTYTLDPCPPGVPWQAEYNAARNCAHRGTWSLALGMLRSLDEKIRDQGPVVRGLAVLATSLAHPEAYQLWHRYAALPTTPRSEAIEAETYAQLTGPQQTIDLVHLVVPVTDTERALERLLADPRVAPSRADPAQFTVPGEPRPKAVLTLQDRPSPDDAQAITLDNVPRVLGFLCLHGKQTDRGARLEIHFRRDASYDAHKQLVRELLGECAGDPIEELDGGKMELVEDIFGIALAMPDNLNEAEILALRTAAVDQALHDVWSATKLDVLDQQTPRDAAQNPAMHVRVLGALSVLEQLAISNSRVGLERLYASLGLPVPETITGATRDQIARMSPIQLLRVDPVSLDDEAVRTAWNRSMILGLRGLRERCGLEMLRREGLVPDRTRADIYGILARGAETSDQALGWIEEARQAAVTAKESPSQWLLVEFQTRLLRGEADEAQRLLNELLTRYQHERHTMQALHELLERAGIIQRDGTPRGAPVAAATEKPATSGLWTPDGPSPAAPEPAGAKSKLWLPGQ